MAADGGDDVLDGTLEALVTLARDGDAAAFEHLVRQFERPALSVACAITGDGHLAGDAVQEGFFRAWRRLGELRDPSRFPAWLTGIVRNAAIDCLRRNRRHAAADLPAAMPAPEDADPAEATARRDAQRRLEQALAELDETTRMAVALRYFDGMNSEQIGRMLEISPAAVDMRLMRARRQLRRKLSGEGRGALKT